MSMSFLLSSRLWPLRSGRREERLNFSPQALTITEVVQIIIIFIFRQLLHVLGLSSINLRISSKDEDTFILPDVHLSMPLRLDQRLLKEYAAAIDLSNESNLSNPAQTCLMLSAFSEPAMLLLLASSRCTILPLGAVNVKNKFELLVPELCTTEALLKMEKAELRARVPTDVRKVKRGLEIGLEVEIVDLDEDVVIFRQAFTMLQFMKFEKSVQSSTKRGLEGDERLNWEKASKTSFNMSLNSPLLWARICKDYNLLHVSTLVAKLLGFRGRIAHGNHALAMGFARQGAEIQQSQKLDLRQEEVIVMQVYFRKPMVLPATLSLHSVGDERENAFKIMNGGAVCVTGMLQSHSRSGYL